MTLEGAEGRIWCSKMVASTVIIIIVVDSSQPGQFLRDANSSVRSMRLHVIATTAYIVCCLLSVSHLSLFDIALLWVNVIIFLALLISSNLY